MSPVAPIVGSVAAGGIMLELMPILGILVVAVTIALLVYLLLLK